jgi:hypothetical protein
MTTDQVDTVKSEFMNDVEQELADDFYEAMMRASRESPRSQQAGRFQLGVSDLGFCPERARRMLDGQVPDDTDVLPAFLGTAIGDHAERAYAAAHPDVLVQAQVENQFRILIDGKPYLVVVPGHPDIIEPEKGRLLDVKTDYGLSDAERQGPDLQKQFQRHTYGKAAWEQGLFAPHIGLADVVVGNVWIDRAAEDRYVHVNLEPLDLDVVDQAQAWLEDVVYHSLNGSEAEKVPPRDMCKVVCGHYAKCRMFDTDVEGLIDDPVTVDRVQMYLEGREQAKAGVGLRKQMSAHLTGVVGTVRLDDGTVLQLRETFVNESLVPEHKRRSYTKLEITEVKR